MCFHKLPNMSILQLKALCEKARFLPGKIVRPQLLLLPQNKVLKLCYKEKKNWFWYFSPLSHLKKTVRQLDALDVRTINVERVLRCSALRCDAMLYAYEEGMNVAEYLADKGNASNFLPFVAAYLADLHEKGVFFPKLHFRHLLYQQEKLILLDMRGLRLCGRPLTIRQRAKSIGRLLRKESDNVQLNAFGVENFLQCYLWHAQLTDNALTTLYQHLRYYVPLLEKNLIENHQ